MPQGILTLQTLGDASPKFADDFEKQLAAAIADCKEHPERTKPRIITLKLSIEPRVADPDDVVIYPSIGSKTPTAEHEPFFARGSRNGQLRFEFVFSPGEAAE
jgi:hypothetical protein